MIDRKKIFIVLAIIVVVFFLLILIILVSRSRQTQTTTIQNQPEIVIPTIGANVQSESLKIQTQADKNFGDWQKDIYTTYPWYDKLPLQTNTYYVYFDLAKKKMIALLYPDKTATSPFYQQIDSLKKEVVDKLQELGIPVAEGEIEWVISP